MLFIIIGIIVGAMVCALLFYYANDNEGSKKICWLAVIPFLICVGLACVKTVPTGYTGILTTFGRVENQTISAGVHIIKPWQKIIKMDNRAQKVSIETAAFSSDIQQVDIILSANYCIDQSTAQELYRSVGANYYETVIYPRILENIKAVFSSYTADTLVSCRSELSRSIDETLSQDLDVYGITVISVAVEDIDFTDAFTDAVEAKQVAEQNKLKAQTEQEQITMESRQAAERQVIAANAEAEVAQIKADAELYAKTKEAEANGALASTLSETLVKYAQANAWNGELPQFVGGNDGSIPILNMK